MPSRQIDHRALMRIGLLASFMLVSVFASAQVDLPSAEEVIEAAEEFDWTKFIPGDKTVTENLLNLIFQGGTITDQTKGLFPSLSRVLNTAVLFFVVGAVSMGGMGYVVHTANKGTLGGGKMSSLMIPLRLAIIVPLLTPLSSGYSASQYLINSVAHAAIWPATEAGKIGAKYIQDFGAPEPYRMSNTSELVRHALISEVCIAYFKDAHSAEELRKINQGGASSLRYRAMYSWPKRGGENAFCGEFEVQNKFELQPLPAMKATATYYQKEIDALEQLLEGAGELVKKYIWVAGESVRSNRANIRKAATGAAGVEYTDVDIPTAIAELIKGIEKLQTDYDTRINAAAVEFVSSVNVTNGQVTWAQEVEKKDFSVVGTYYFSMLKYQDFVKTAFQSNTSFTMPTMHNGRSSYLKTIEKDGETLGVAYEFINNAYQLIGNQSSDIGNIEAMDFAVKPKFSMNLVAAFSNYVVGYTHNYVVKNFLTVEDGAGGVRNRDLVVVMQSFGSTLISLLDAMFLLWLLLSIAGNAAAQAAGGSALSLIGVGGAIQGGVEGVLGYFGSLIVPLLLYLLGLSFFLAYWLPAIPVITWIMAYFGWLILFFSALIIIPMWLATLAIATDDTWMTTHQRQGWVLVFGLFARPTIMVMTFFGVFVLMNVAGFLFSWFSAFVLTLSYGGFAGLFAWAFMLTIVCIFAYNLVTRVFSLIPELADRIMQGLNAGQPTFGEQQTEIQGRGAALSAGAALVSGGVTPLLDTNKGRSGGKGSDKGDENGRA